MIAGQGRPRLTLRLQVKVPPRLHFYRRSTLFRHISPAVLLLSKALPIQAGKQMPPHLLAKQHPRTRRLARFLSPPTHSTHSRPLAPPLLLQPSSSHLADYRMAPNPRLSHSKLAATGPRSSSSTTQSHSSTRSRPGSTMIPRPTSSFWRSSRHISVTRGTLQRCTSKSPNCSPMRLTCLMNSSSSCPRTGQAVSVCFLAHSCKLPAPHLPLLPPQPPPPPPPKKSQVKREVRARRVRRWVVRRNGGRLRVPVSSPVLLPRQLKAANAGPVPARGGRVPCWKTSSLDSPSLRLSNKRSRPPTKSHSLTRSRNSLTTRSSTTSFSNSSTFSCRI